MKTSGAAVKPSPADSKRILSKGRKYTAFHSKRLENICFLCSFACRISLCKLTGQFPDIRFLDVGEVYVFLLMPEALHGMRSSPETGPRRAELVVGKNRNKVEIRSKSPGARIAEWVSRERSGRRRSVSYADRTEHEMRSE